MAGESDALEGKVSERALEALEIFTRHCGTNEDDLRGWREFIIYTHLDRRPATRDTLREHLRVARSDDSTERIENWLDEYEEAMQVLKTYDQVARDSS